MRRDTVTRVRLQVAPAAAGQTGELRSVKAWRRLLTVPGYALAWLLWIGLLLSAEWALRRFWGMV